MKIFLDCSDVDLIKQSFASGLIDGVTTNPSLMLKAGLDPLVVLKEISENHNNIFAYPVDVTDRSQCNKVFNQILEKFLGNLNGFH